MDAVWTWELSGYCAKYSFLVKPQGMTMWEAEHSFQIEPEPPALENLNDYIVEAAQHHELRWFSFFLHHYENRLNGRIRRFYCGRGWIIMTLNGSWTIKWAVYLPCWTVSRDMTLHRERSF